MCTSHLLRLESLWGEKGNSGDQESKNMGVFLLLRTSQPLCCKPSLLPTIWEGEDTPTLPVGLTSPAAPTALLWGILFILFICPSSN